MLKNWKRSVAFFLVIVMAFVSNVTVFASAQDISSLLNDNRAEIENTLQQVLNYSYYDEGDFIIEHDIVTDGVLTEDQYQDALSAVAMWQQVEDKYGLEYVQTRVAIPAALAAVLATVAVLFGEAIVGEITSYFMTWGMTAGCQKFQDIDLIRSFCEANDFL
ncbi:hypothetical protein [Allofournierella massiliensis]|uniref:Uncharacterized protein n=1 Tax=Allofournierella massiliensis TaxID=1650663 RepID=A0ABT7UT11_9FIRM|nr:hypothetical protein [Fournierella massiliensis]MDM8202033.1 hypothetical protein [Fournierella massiliensis]